MKKKNPLLLVRRLLLHYTKYLQKTTMRGDFDLPEMHCHTKVLPDYIAVYQQPGDYHRTLFTAVAFFSYDDVFDGQHGLYNAIYYDNKRDLQRFKERFKGVHFAIAPDCSQCGDVDHIENLYRLKRSRIISLWLNQEMGISVIPLITFPNLKHLGWVLEGLQDCSVVAFSTKGCVDDSYEKSILMEAVRITVDTLKLKAILVYDVCKDNQAVDEIFAYARQKGIEVKVPLNMLKERNIVLAKERRTKKCA